MEPLNTRHLPRTRLVAGMHRPLGRVSIDSRTLASAATPHTGSEATFFCLRGPRFDGHDHVAAAVEAGATVVVVDGRSLGKIPGRLLDGRVTVLCTDDTQLALGAAAAELRSRFEGRVIAVTGSSGKTTTKEMIGTILSRAGSTLVTAGNLNNHLGLPLTLLRLTAAHRFAVVELGMSARGEIAKLTRMARPEIGVITTVGPAHLQSLRTLDQVAAAKGELFVALPPDGLAIMPSDIERPWRLTRGSRAPLVVVGGRPADEVRLLSARETPAGARGTVETDHVRHPLRLRLNGRHNLTNALLALAVGRAVGVPMPDALAALESMSPPPMRGELHTLPDGSRLILDCYNANPQSMRAAVETFATVARTGGVLILGDMLELGETAIEAHETIGRLVAGLAGKLSRLILIGVGAQSSVLVGAAREAGMGRTRTVAVPDADEAIAALRRLRRPGDWLLLKGSRGVRLERVWNDLSRSLRPPARGRRGLTP